MFVPENSSRGRARATKALEEGRIPGKPGPKPLSEEDRNARRLAKYARFRSKHLEERRIYEAEWARNKRHKKAIEEGRVPGIIGHLSTFKADELFDYLSKWRGDDRKFIHQAKAQNSRAKNLGIFGKITSRDVIEQFLSQEGCCAFCGNTFNDTIPEIDHWIPFKLGGQNVPSNIRLLHKSCNRTKGPKHPKLFLLMNTKERENNVS